MSLENVLKAIKENKPFAEENVESGPMETLNGRRGRKNQAIEALGRLKTEYLSDLLKSAVFIVVAGSERTEFEKVATTKFNLFSADPETFYNDLAGRVSPSLYLGKEGVNNIFDVLGRHLEDKMSELGAVQYNQLIFKEKYIKTVTSVADFTSIVKEAINDQLGTEIVAIQSVNSILDSAIDRNHSSKTTSIVLTTGDEKLTQDLLKDLDKRGNRVTLVLAGKTSKAFKGLENTVNVKEVTEESVKTALDSIKNLLKK
jgi:hypothetical protein